MSQMLWQYEQKDCIREGIVNNKKVWESVRIGLKVEKVWESFLKVEKLWDNVPKVEKVC